MRETRREGKSRTEGERGKRKEKMTIGKRREEKYKKLSNSMPQTFH